MRDYVRDADLKVAIIERMPKMNIHLSKSKAFDESLHDQTLVSYHFSINRIWLKAQNPCKLIAWTTAKNR